MKRFRVLAAAGVAVVVALSTAVYAAGLWSTLPIIGGAAYCTGTVTGTGNLGGITGQGQGTIGSICGLNEPAGPATFSGTEMIPLDLLAPGTQSQGPQTSAIINITQLGQGPYVDQGSPTTATIPNNTPFYFVDGAQSSNFTLTMPPNPIEGQIQRVTCEHSTSGTLHVSANSNQTLNGDPAAACSTYNTYSWRYLAASSYWYRF